jgi:hypothetical protein
MYWAGEYARRICMAARHVSHSYALWVGLMLSACTVYQPELLLDAAAVTGGGSGGSSSGGGVAGTAGGGGAAGTAGGSEVLVGGEAGMAAGGAEPGPEDGGQGGEGGNVTEPTAGSSAVGGSGGGGAGGSSAGSSGAAAAGSAGTAGSGGTDVGTPLNPNLIDGFEDDNLTLQRSDDRGGQWYLFNDGTAGKAGPSPLACSPLVGAPAELGRLAMHVTASGFSAWGSGLGADFRAGKREYDASAFVGVRFWAKIGQGSTAFHRLQLVDANSDKAGEKCDGTATAPEGQKCGDHFGIDVRLTTSWTLHEVEFADLDQLGFGLPAPRVDSARLFGLQFTAAGIVDLWLDEIAFY